MVEIACLRHHVNNVAIHIYRHDYIRMEITVLYLKISWHQLSIPWSQISVYWRRISGASKLNLPPSSLQLMPWNFQIQYSYRIAGKLRRLQFSRCRCKRGVFNLSEHQISRYRVLGKNKIIVIIVSMLCK